MTAPGSTPALTHCASEPVLSFYYIIEITGDGDTWGEPRVVSAADEVAALASAKQADRSDDDGIGLLREIPWAHYETLRLYLVDATGGEKKRSF